MRNRMPGVQKTWREFQDKYADGLSILDRWKVVVNIQEMLYWIIPHILAGHWYSTFSMPSKNRHGKRRNRNL